MHQVLSPFSANFLQLLFPAKLSLQMNFFLTTLALACCIYAHPDPMNLNWLRSTDQKFTHYGKQIAQSQAQLEKAVAENEKTLLRLRIENKVRKQQKFAPKPTFAETMIKETEDFKNQLDEVSASLAAAQEKLNAITTQLPIHDQHLVGIMKKIQDLDTIHLNFEQLEDLKQAVKALEDSLSIKRE